MGKENTVSCKWQKQISSVSQVSNLVILQETLLTTVMSAGSSSENTKIITNSRVCNTEEGEGERQMAVLTFLSNTNHWKSLGRTIARASDTFPQLKVTMVLSFLGSFVVFLGWWPWYQTGKPLQEVAVADSGVCNPCKELQVPVPVRQHWMSDKEFESGL